LEELLSRNPQNLKLILLSDFRVQDCDGHQKYRIDQAVLSSHRWYLYGEKVRKHATVQEKRRGVLKKLFQRTSDPRDFLINLKGQDAGTLKTICMDGRRIGTTDFNHWRAEGNQIFNEDQCIATFQKVKSWTEEKYVLDYSKEIDEIIMLLVLYSMRKAEQHKVT